MTVWIGFIQWQKDNGFPIEHEPILQSLQNFQLKDAILDLTDPQNPIEPEWPDADFIVGNPPFLGGKRLRTGLGDAYVDRMFSLWREYIRPEADLCCYWFEKARRQIELGKCRRVGLLATQGIRGGANRHTLNRIKSTGDVFFAVSDRDWVIDGATVHISIVGFDDGADQNKTLDGLRVPSINSNLSSKADVTQARRLVENSGFAFMGDTKGGGFDIPERQAMSLLNSPNPHGRPNSDVIVPWINGMGLSRRDRSYWIIDFGLDRSKAEASLYEQPFAFAEKHILPGRLKNKRQLYKDRWWIHVESRPTMRMRLRLLPRFIGTVRHSKYRIFFWSQSPTLPDSALIVFTRDDDLVFGMLHSRLHEVWSREQGTQVRERESGFRYTPTSCFETFPFPDAAQVQQELIEQSAKRLTELRDQWLNPREWLREETLEFPGSIDGPWARYIHDPNDRGIGTVRYPRLVPKDAHVFDLAKRTLTRLYNERPTWLDLAHKALDDAVFDAYGWDPSMTDEQILAALLKLNLERSASGDAAPTGDEVEEEPEASDPD